MKNFIITMYVLLYIIYGVLCVFVCLYVYFKYKFSYWKKRGVPYIEPNFISGNLQLRNNTHQAFWTQNIYRKMKSKGLFCGMYIFAKPIALITNLDLVKTIFVRDFNSFHDRGFYHNERDDPLSAHLFSLEGDKWKKLRSKLSPAFTSCKMKYMFPTIIEVGNELEKALEMLIKTDDEIEIKDLLARFTTDVIGTCAFGITCNSFTKPEAEFQNMGRRAFQEIQVKALFLLAFKKLAIFLRIKAINQEVSDFFMNIVYETVQFREKYNIKRNDFMNILLQLKQTGKLDDEQSSAGYLSMNEVAAQAFVFFLAGFETSSTTMMFCLYELALNPDIQERTRMEINKVLLKHDGNVTYETIMDMSYLDQVIYETLRKYPPVGNLFREATKDFRIPETDKVLDAGTIVWIPVYAIHHDPEIYPKPHIFDPDRFSPENVKTRPNNSFLSFGDGPRGCIGIRFGMLQTRIGLVTLLKKYSFEPCLRTQIPLKFDPKQFVLTTNNDIFIKVKKIL